MSPLGAVTTSDGSLKCVGPPPAAPAVPSLIRTFPSGDSLMTCCPLVPSLLVCASVTQMLPSRSTCNPCGNTNRPPPMLLIGFAVARSIRCIGGSSEPSQLLTPHRSIAQISLRGPISTPAVEPHVLLSGRMPQLRTPG